MNERIKLLAEQAKAESNQWLGSKPAITITYDEFEKFAELIIKKCISQIALIGISNFENEDISWTVETVIANIKQHFGVEE